MTEITLSAKDRFLKKEYRQKTLVVVETVFIFFFVPFYFLMMVGNSNAKSLFEVGLMALIFGLGSFIFIVMKYESDIEELKNEVASLKGETIEEKKSEVSNVVITKLQKKILIGLNGLGLIFIVGVFIWGVDELVHEIKGLYKSALIFDLYNDLDLVRKERESLRQNAVSKIQELQLQVNRLEAENADREKSGKGL